MNILFLMGVYPSFGGVERVSTILANEFVSRGHNVCIVSFVQPHPEFAEQNLDNTVKLFKLNNPVKSSNNINVLSDIIKENSIDIIINQWAVPYVVSRLCRHAIKRSNRSCRLITVHHNTPDTNSKIKGVEIDISNKNGNWLLNKIKLTAIRFISRLNLKAVYHLSDDFVVLSDSFREIFSRFIFDKKIKKLSVIPNPITICETSTSLNFQKQKEIIYVGRLEYNQKRCFRLLDVWENLYTKFPDWKLTIVGDGPDRHDMQQRIEEKKLHRVEITGFCDPIPYYRRASILCLLSEYEGFGLVIIEGMKFGVVPLVLGSYSAIYDIIDNNINGVISDMPYNQHRYSEELCRLMSDSSGLLSKSIRAKEKSEVFSLNNIVDCWERLLSSNFKEGQL